MITVVDNIVIVALSTVCIAIVKGVLWQILALMGVLIYLQPGNSTCELV
jgi:hypothetical protein